MTRIYVTGTSCSGKTTLARAISERFGLPHVELDALFWGPSWTPVPDATFRARVAEALAADRWVLDGGYAKLHDLTWARAELVIWLDYPMPVILGRWAGRTLRRLRSREEFWPGTGNRETVRNALRSDGLLWWILRTHRGRRRRNERRIRQHPTIPVLRMRSPDQTEQWLVALERSPGG
ncbi:MAG TPA: hypothetical protein VEW95_11165 [Candidatus Limnocylindrales bacterium]|nr:hypothetical protein [Candidatus Limnocylindrales bacterium]